jgi:hypothetical protein
VIRSAVKHSFEANHYVIQYSCVGVNGSVVLWLHAEHCQCYGFCLAAIPVRISLYCTRAACGRVLVCVTLQAFLLGVTGLVISYIKAALLQCTVLRTIAHSYASLTAAVACPVSVHTTCALRALLQLILLHICSSNAVCCYACVTTAAAALHTT